MTILNKAERNVLEALNDATRKKTGDLKRRVSADCYYANVVSSLHKKGLIDWDQETIHGTGYAVTLSGASAIAKK